MTDNELTYTTARVHTLLVGIAKMNALPNACVDDFIDSLSEPETEMIEGQMSGAVRNHRHSGFINERRDQTLGHSAASRCRPTDIPEKAVSQGRRANSDRA